MNQTLLIVVLFIVCGGERVNSVEPVLTTPHHKPSTTGANFRVECVVIYVGSFLYKWRVEEKVYPRIPTLPHHEDGVLRVLNVRWWTINLKEFHCLDVKEYLYFALFKT
jgi:hypothetical protein